MDCFPFTDRHTAENLKDELTRVVTEWGIKEKVFAIATDNAANITKAVKLTSWNHLSCLAHTINLIVQGGIKEINHIQTKIKAIVEYFHRSTIAAEKLKSMQQQMNSDSPPLKLKMDVITRWNSTYAMFERMCAVQQPLEAAIGILHNPVDSLNTGEWELLRECCRILKPFEQISTELSAEEHVTISKVIVMVRCITSSLARLHSVTNNRESVRLLDALLHGMRTRFAGIESNMIFAKSTILDPRFKSRGFNDDAAYKKASQILRKNIAALIPAEVPQIRPSSASTSSDISTSAENFLWGDFDRSVTHVTTTPVSSALMEFRQYIEEPIIMRTEDPLLWWKSREMIYPKLSILARKYLGIVATSVPSERIFSKTGQIVSEKRNRLKPKHVQQLVFLNANQKYMP